MDDQDSEIFFPGAKIRASNSEIFKNLVKSKENFNLENDENERLENNI